MRRLSRPLTVALGLAAAVALMAVVLFVAATLTYTPPSLTGAVQALLVRTGAREVKVGAVSITPVRSMHIDSVTAVLPDPAMGATTVRVARIDMTFSPVELLRRGRRLRTAADAVLWKKGMAALPKLEQLIYALGDAGIGKVVDAVDVVGIDVSCDGGTAGPARAGGGRLSYVFSGDGGFGETTIDTVVVHRQHAITGVQAAFRIDGDAVDIDSLYGRYAGGLLRSRAAVRLRERMLDTLSCDLTALDAGEWHRTVGGEAGSLGGAVDVRVRFGRSRLVADSLTGTIRIASSDLTADGTPLQQTLATLFGTDDMTSFSFERVSANMTLSAGQLDVREAEAVGRPLSFATHGWVRFDGTLRQSLTGSLDRATVEELSPLVRHVLIRAPNGERRFVCEVTGAFARPVISLEKGMMKRAVERAIEELMIDD